MKRTLFVASLGCFLIHSSATGKIGYPQKDESMARVQRLLMATTFEVPSAEVAQWQEDLRTVGYLDFPAFKRFLADEPNDDFTYDAILSFISKIDGVNMCSTGDEDILRMTREILTVKSANPDWRFVDYGLHYLSQKGDSRDLALLEKYSTIPSRLPVRKQQALDCSQILQSRVAGTNLLTGLKSRYYSWSTNEPPFLPSIANTGPQAVYVYDLLKQALAKYGDATNIPPELVTMVVSLGADGKPACNVDLAKYGLVMTAFESGPPQVPIDVGSPASVKASALPSVTNAPPVYAAKTSVRFFVPLFGIAVGIVVLLSVAGIFLALKRR